MSSTSTPPPPTSSSSNSQNPIPSSTSNAPLITATSTVTTAAHVETEAEEATADRNKDHELYRDADVFWNLVHQFHDSIGNRIRVPKIGGKTLNLHLLFIEVTSRGGFDKVLSDRRWKEVIAAFNFPSTITSASYVIRKYYAALLYQFEQVYYFGKQVPLPQKLEPAQPTSPELQRGSSVIGVIDAKFDSGYLVSVTIGGEVLKGVLYHVPQETQISETLTASVLPPERRRWSHKSSNDPSSKKSRKSYSLSFSEDYARVQPVCYEQEEKVTTSNMASSQSKLTGVDKQAYLEKGENGGNAGC